MKIRLNKSIASFLGAVAIRLLGLTWRIQWRGQEQLEKARRLSPRIIFAFWHGRLLALSYSHRNSGVSVLASEHYDGDLMGRTIVWLGFGHVKGSSSKGGGRALRSLAAVLKGGRDVGLTIDGPRGPRGEVRQGAIELSRLAGAAVLPVSNTASRRKLFDSWDRFQLPAPFATIVVAYGEPFIVPPGATVSERESFKLGLKENLSGLTSRLDIEMGYKGSQVWPHEDS